MIETALQTLAQDNTLQRMFKDALVPSDMFRRSVTPEKFPGAAGGRMVMTRQGRIQPNPTRLQPGQDSQVVTQGFEHYAVEVGPYSKSVDIPLDQGQQLTASGGLLGFVAGKVQAVGELAGAELNLAARDVLFKNYLSGHSISTAAVNNAAAIDINTLNGFRLVFVGKSEIPVSNVNKIPIKIYTNGTVVTVNVIGATPADVNFPDGPGTLTLDANVTAVQFAAVVADNAPYIVRPNDAKSIDGLTMNDTATMDLVRALKARMKVNSVKPMPDGTYHFHAPPQMIRQMFASNEIQRMQEGQIASGFVRDGSLGVVHGIKFFENETCPLPFSTNTVQTIEVPNRPSGDLAVSYCGEQMNVEGINVLRGVMLGLDSFYEYWVDEMEYYATELEQVGKSRMPYTWTPSEAGGSMTVERVRMIYRKALDRRAVLPALSYSFTGGWTCPTDSLGGQTIAKLKRAGVLEVAGQI